MQVLHITATDGQGGAGVIPLSLHHRLPSYGIASSMFTGSRFSDDPTVHKIKKAKWRSVLSHLLANDSAYYATDYLLDTPQFHEADIIHAHNLHGWYFNLGTLQKMAQHKPIVWTLHDMWAITPHCAHAYDNQCTDGFYACPSRSDYPSIWWPNEYCLKKQKRAVYATTPLSLVTPSRWLAEKVQQSVLKTKPLTVIPNGIDTTTFTPQDQVSVRTALGLPLNKKIILFIAHQGLANEFKGGALVRKVASLFSKETDTIFLCVGGSTDESIDNLILRHGSSNKSLLAQYYAAADVLLFPSLAENFPLVVLEALACGLPVVAHDVGGVKEAVVHEKTGYIATYNDVAGLKKGIEMYTTLSPSEHHETMKACRTRVETHYSLETMVEAYTKLYTTLV